MPILPYEPDSHPDTLLEFPPANVRWWAACTLPRREKVFITNPDAARAKGLPGPLIFNREGCHAWKPETFPPDDPRRGWTWDDGWEDVVALLGREERRRHGRNLAGDG